MYYIAKTYLYLVVENPVEFLGQPLINPTVPDITNWVPDETIIRRELPQLANSDAPAADGDDASRTKRARTTHPAVTQTEPSITSALTNDDDGPLMTDEDIANFLK
ncbi:hypothetical protein PGTUg99_021035 [Puccinia graminis f. sp. tritici]|uniref:Uncharacterized protein n=1 Tax=Puccinia graminis f. sp. tritici TaxID=56615 RepID=A0A5B0LNN3_PUCGR|nr:hypothetical protein PGTUg99_021035 [Puccinia graminis f. sp. tritici]